MIIEKMIIFLHYKTTILASKLILSSLNIVEKTVNFIDQDEQLLPTLKNKQREQN